MSIKRMSAVWDHSQHKGSALLLMLAIADVADDLGVAWPGYAHLARKIRMSRDSVIRLTDVCHTSGELWKLPRPDQQSNIYVVTIDLTIQELEAAAQKAVAYGVVPPTGSSNLRLPPTTGSSNLRLGGTIAMHIGSGIAIVPDPSLPVITQEDNLWIQTLDLLRARLARETFDAHLLGSTATQNNGTLTVTLRRALSVPWCDRLRPTITAALTHQAGHELKIEFITHEVHE